MGKYSKEFIEEALKLSDEIGVKQASSQLGARYQTLTEWRSIRKRHSEKSLSREEQAIRLRELGRENAELEKLTRMAATLGTLGLFVGRKRKSGRAKDNRPPGSYRRRRSADDSRRAIIIFARAGASCQSSSSNLSISVTMNSKETASFPSQVIFALKI